MLSNWCGGGGGQAALREALLGPGMSTQFDLSMSAHFDK